MGDQDRRMLLAIVLSLGVYLLWFGSFGPSQTVEDPALEQTEESTEEGAEVSDGAVESTPTGGDSTASASVAPLETDSGAEGSEPAAPAAQVYASAAIETAHSEMMEAEARGLIEGTEKDHGRWSGEVHSDNGALRNVVLHDYTTAPMYHSIWGHGFSKITGSETPEDGWSPYSGSQDRHVLLTEDAGLVFAGSDQLGDDGAAGLEDEAGAYTVQAMDGGVQATRTTAEGLQITKKYLYNSDPYIVDVEVEFSNLSSKTLSGLWVGVAERMSGDAGRFMSAIRPNAYVDEDIENIYEIDELEGDGISQFEGRVDWFGVGDRYFMGVLIPQSEESGDLVVDQLPGGRVGSFIIYDEPLNPGDTRSLTYKAYIGPKSLDILEPMGPALEQAVEFGWFGVFSKPLLWLLKSLHSAVGNWGVAIILLTLLIKLLFFRLTQKTYESSHRMQALQPQLKEIREKFKDNRELQTQETMKLFKENKVNPMGSCLPMLLQLPVWFALYNTMLYSVELYHTQFLIFDDLTAPDPYGILPTAYVLLMIGQQRMMPMASMDPTQRKVMKAMPLIFGFFMYTFPSGLVLYFCVNMLLTMVQQWIIKRNLGPSPAEHAAS